VSQVGFGKSETFIDKMWLKASTMFWFPWLFGYVKQKNGCHKRDREMAPWCSAKFDKLSKTPMPLTGLENWKIALKLAVHLWFLWSQKRKWIKHMF
jgi:hypothetical protein